MTFDLGVPSMETLIVTPFGLATMKTFHEDGTVDLYVGGGRVFRVPASSQWQEAAAKRKPQ